MNQIDTTNPVEIYTNKVSTLVDEYRYCVSKTASSILELANVVFRAKEDLTDQDYDHFRVLIKADKSKDSYLKKLYCIAQKSSRLNSIKDKLPAAYTTLYELTKLTDDEFNLVCDADVIRPNLTAKELCKFKPKTVKPAVISPNTITFTIKSSSTLSLHKILFQINNLCTNLNVEINSNFDFSTLNQIDDIEPINLEIKDVTSKKFSA